MNRETEARDLADALESLRTGHLSERQFRLKYQGLNEAALSGLLWPNLEHYLSDSDIRDRDPAYGAMQDAEMQKLVTLLRAGARFRIGQDQVSRSFLKIAP